MLYLINLTEVEAKQRSKEICTARNCTENITTYWFGWFKHIERDEWALSVKEEETSFLTPEEQAILKTEEYMRADNWFYEG